MISMSSVLRKLKIAFLGGSVESAVGRVHRAAIEMDQRFELVAGCFSRRAEISRLSAFKYGLNPERAYHTLDQLLTSEASRIDAIVILTPQDQHGQHVKNAWIATRRKTSFWFG